jgi:hypothetical protein
MANGAPAWISALEPSTALALADAILALHLAIVAFNVAMPPAIGLGAWLGWRWVRRRWLRLLHLGSMLVVALQAALGDLCFLTVWEVDLRRAAGDAASNDSFIQTLLAEVLYVDAPLSVLIPLYLGWAALSVALWWIVPPRRHDQRRGALRS